jgi:transposase-like protein
MPGVILRTSASLPVNGAQLSSRPGLATALREPWPTLAIQRCTTHKRRNLEAQAPARLGEALAEDYHRMIYADSRATVDQARAASSRCGGSAAPP